MPLLDHFRPPLLNRRHWTSFHSAWANALCQQLNAGVLPPDYFAEPHAHLGGGIEVDAGTFEGDREHESWPEAGGVAVWAPPRPARVAALDFALADVFEVRVFSEIAGPVLRAAIELVSPAIKDRPSSRRMFAAKCASYLHGGVGVVLADVVTTRSGSLHDEMLDLLGIPPEPASPPLYATAYRIAAGAESLRLECWIEGLSLGSALPRLPLWIEPDLVLPLDLEPAYLAACATLRMG